MAENIDALLADLAEEQLGLATIEQSRAIGMTDEMRIRRLGDGRLSRMGRRVLRVAGAPVTWEQRLLAAVLEGGDGTVVSHMAAAARLGFPGVDTGAVEVSLPRGRRAPAALLGVAHRPAHLPNKDIQKDGLFLITTPTRTLIDVSHRLSAVQLESALDTLCQSSLLSPSYVEKRLYELGSRGRVGSARLRALLASEPKAQSGRRSNRLQKRALALIKRAGLGPVEPEARIVVNGRPYYADILFVDARLVVELDGHGSHSTRRQRQHDAERAAALTNRGYRVVVFTREDVEERPEYVVSTLRQLLHATNS